MTLLFLAVLFILLNAPLWFVKWDRHPTQNAFPPIAVWEHDEHGVGYWASEDKPHGTYYDGTSFWDWNGVRWLKLP